MRQHRAINESHDRWKKSSTGQERQAIGRYTNDIIYTQVNGSLRGKIPASDKITTLITHLDQAISKSAVPETLVMYRGITNVNFDKIGIGGAFLDKAYSSITAKLATAKKFAAGKKSTLLSITIPKGAKGLYLNGLSQFPDEQEVLLPRSSQYRIDRKESKGGRQILHVTLL